MKDFTIFTDLACDLDKQMRTELNVEYVKMQLSVDGKEFLCDLDGEAIPPLTFYNNLKNGVRYLTSLIPEDTYYTEFEKHIVNGKDVLYLACSSALTASIGQAIKAREHLLEKYPDAKIYCVDTLRGTLAEGLIVYYAANMKKDGKSIEEIAAWVEDNKLNIHQVGTVDDLIYLKRAGRVTGMAATMAKLMNIKPLIIADSKGQNKSVSKVRGRKMSIKAMFKCISDNIIDPEEQTIFVCHANCPEEAERIKEQLFAEFKCKDVYINIVGPIIGATVGPGMLGIFFKGKKVTE